MLLTLMRMACVGERGAMYACQPENGHPAQVMYKPYSGWASSGEWSFTLPEGETVIALAAGGTPPSRSLRDKSSEGDVEGNGNVVLATNRGYLRFFTGGGVQRYIWALGADVVTMVAGREWVFVVHRDGGTSLDGM
jgi:chromosome transmission fidelity protein 4